MMKKTNPKINQKTTAIGKNITINQYIFGEGSPDIEENNNSTPRKRLRISSENPYLGDQKALKTKLSASVKWVQNVQNSDWGLPSNDLGTESCAWVTAGLLYSSYVFKGTTPEWWKSGLQWVKSQVLDSGGMPFGSGTGNFSVTDATALALLCVLEFNSEDRIIEGLAQWLLNIQRRSGGFPWCMDSPKENVISTSYALLALKQYMTTYEEFDQRTVDALEKGLKWLERIRNVDGGWGSEENDKSRPANTGFVVYVFNVFSMQSVCDESKAFLIDSFDEENGGWLDSIDRPLPHNVTRLGLPYALLGLACLSGDNDVNTYIDKAINLILKNYNDGIYNAPITNAKTWPTRDLMLAISSVID